MLKLFKANIKQANIIKNIYKEAFPLVERKPFLSVKRSLKAGRMELIIAQNENDEVVGFATCFPYKDMMYLDYLAMAKEMRGKGYGTIFLQEVFKLYKGKRLTLIMERPDEPCDNKEQRIKRKAFYLHCGMKETNLFTNAKSGHYEILVHGGDITGEEFIEVIEYSLGRLFTKLAKYHIVK